jgi:hypothetical protein
VLAQSSRGWVWAFLRLSLVGTNAGNGLSPDGHLRTRKNHPARAFI